MAKIEMAIGKFHFAGQFKNRSCAIERINKLGYKKSHTKIVVHKVAIKPNFIESLFGSKTKYNTSYLLYLNNTDSNYKK